MLLHFTDFADGKIIQQEGAVCKADEARNLQPEIFQNLADFAVLALGDDHFDPDIRTCPPFDIGVDRAVTHTVNLNAQHQIFKLSLRHIAISARAIDTFYAG